MKNLFAFSIIFSLLLAFHAGAQPPNFIPATVAKSPVGPEVTIPETAVEVTPGVFSLPLSLDPVSGQIVEGVLFIHRSPSRQNQTPSSRQTKSPKCYSYLARGAKWTTVEPWVVNPANTRGLTADFVLSNLTSDIAKWEDAADGVVGDSAGVDILGTGVSTSTLLSADTSSPDGKNEVFFGNISETGTIAFTIVWYNRFTKQLVEWDQVYDEVEYDWSASGETGKMDFENIATHELGHSVGMGHPSDSCIEETMYRFSTSGETKKRTLNAGDVAGINELY